MKAAVVDHSAPGHAKLADVDDPGAGYHEAIVRVHAVSLNLGEVRYAQSMEPGSRIGWDLAGVVEKAAEDQAGPPAGTRVVGFLSRGAWAELAAVPTWSMAEIPDNVSFSQAATLPVAGLTALKVLEKGHGLLGRRVLITGANGGVGMFALQLAALMGAEPVAQIRRQEYAEMVQQMGAVHLAVSEDGSAAEEFGPYRLIAESVSGEVMSRVLPMLAPDGVCVTYGTSSSSDATISIRALMTAERASLYGFLLFNELEIEPAADGLARLVRLVSEGRLKTPITVEEPWERIGEVVRDLWDRKIPGKAVLRVGQG